jgi:peptidoglycan hydrolase-like protein with peptidoglycan-binding domain
MNRLLSFNPEPFETYSELEHAFETCAATKGEYETGSPFGELELASEARNFLAEDSRAESRFFHPEPTGLEWENEVDRSNREYVRWVQQSLNRVKGLRLPVDGVMGLQTRSAVRSFQQQQGLPADGILGPRTERALIAAGAVSPPSAGAVSTSAPMPDAVWVPTVTAKQNNIIFGLDTYSGDGNKKPNWAQAKAQVPIDFAIIQSNYGVWEDSVFKRDWPRLKDAVIVRGAYLFLRFPPPVSKYHEKKVPDPVSQAEAFIKTVGTLHESDLPPSLDVEFPGGRQFTGMTARQLLDGVRAAWKVLKDHYHVAPIIYTSARVWQEDLSNLPALDLVESPLWLAKPWPFKLHHPAVWNAGIFAGGHLDPKVPSTWGPGNWWIHQYQGDADARALSGFNQVDMDRFNPMRAGVSGDRVMWVQRRLGIVQNGRFDSAMSSALRTFQDKKGLPPNGVIDPRTFAYLCWSNP